MHTSVAGQFPRADRTTMATVYPRRSPWLSDVHSHNNKFKATALQNFGETT
jgi:hypothetical protein